MTVQSSKLQSVFDERISALVDDRYCVRVRSYTPTLFLARLHHMSNGNDIIIKAFPEVGRLQQYTKHIMTHDEIVTMPG